MVGVAELRVAAQEKSYRHAKDIAVGTEGGWDYASVDPEGHRLYVTHGNEVVVIDTTTDKVAGSVPIGSGVDANAFDPQLKLAFSSNGEGTITVAHEDSPTKLTVVQTIKTQRGTRTMTLDPLTHKIYAAAADFEPAPAATADNPRPRPKMVSGSFKVLVYEMGSIAKGGGSM